MVDLVVVVLCCQVEARLIPTDSFVLMLVQITSAATVPADTAAATATAAIATAASAAAVAVAATTATATASTTPAAAVQYLWYKYA